MSREEMNKRNQCVNSCMSIYQDFTEDEAKKKPYSVYGAWLNGRDIQEILYPEPKEN